MAAHRELPAHQNRVPTIEADVQIVGAMHGSDEGQCHQNNCNQRLVVRHVVCCCAVHVPRTNNELQFGVRYTFYTLDARSRLALFTQRCAPYLIRVICITHE